LRRRFVCIAHAIVGAALVVGSAPRSRADDALDLVWTAPAECPDVDAVRASVRQMVRSGERPKLAARVSVHKEASSYRAEVSLERGDGSSGNVRSLEGGTCAELTDAVSLVLALTIDPTAAAPARTAAAPTASAAPSPPATTAPTVASSAAPVASTVSSRSVYGARVPVPVPVPVPVHVATSAGAFLDSSMLPSLAAGARLGVQGSYGWGRLELRGALAFENEAAIANRAAGARYRFFALGVLPGAQVFSLGPVSLELLAGGQWVRMLGSSFGVSQVADGGTSLAVLDAAAVARFELFSWLVLRAEIDGWVPLTRPSFVVEGLGALHRVPAISLQGGLSLAVVLF
jgi:hypothetical protein